ARTALEERRSRVSDRRRADQPSARERQPLGRRRPPRVIPRTKARIRGQRSPAAGLDLRARRDRYRERLDPRPHQRRPATASGDRSAGWSMSTSGARRFNALVVEDSPPMRKMIVFALSRVRELDVVEADDGVDALRRIAGTKFDIIITDINMPILDGLKLVKRLRADDNYKDVPIVIITTEGAAEDRQRALALGANAYITKPIQAQQVISLVREILSLD